MEQIKPNYKCSIIANPEGGSWKFANEVYGYVRNKLKENYRGEKRRYVEEIKGELESRLPDITDERKHELEVFAEILYEKQRGKLEDWIELNKLNIRKFRDGEHKPKILDNIRDCNVFYIHDSNLNPDEWLAQLITVEDAIRSSSPHKATYVMPYKRFTRQERKDESRTSISTRAIAKILNEVHNGVLTIDIHSEAIPGNFRIPFDALYSFPTVIAYLKNNYPEILNDLVVVSPDAGGGKRAEAFAKKVNGKDVVIGYKVRPEEGKVGKLRLRDFKGKQVLIIDDILDSGGTLIEASKAARNQGAERVYAYVTHPLFTKGYEEVINNFKRLFVGNTVNHSDLEKYEKVSVISFTELFGEAIYRMSQGKSISALFN